MSVPDNSIAQHTPQWYSCATSVVGHVRKINEDAFLDARERGLWVVADGMGGHSRGDRASQAIISNMQGFTPTGDTQADLDDIIARLNQANGFCRSEVSGEVMGSTVALLYTRGDKAFIVWAGDSRIYRYRNSTMQQLTDDHSLVGELHRLGELTEDEAENHPSSNVITRAVGVSDELELQTRQIELQAGDRYLLCSDGLFKDVQKNEVETNLGLPSMEQALDKLVNLALKRGGTDNVTGIVAQLDTGFVSGAQPGNQLTDVS